MTDTTKAWKTDGWPLNKIFGTRYPPDSSYGTSCKTAAKAEVRQMMKTEIVDSVFEVRDNDMSRTEFLSDNCKKKTNRGICCLNIMGSE